MRGFLLAADFVEDALRELGQLAHGVQVQFGNDAPSSRQVVQAVGTRRQRVYNTLGVEA